MATLKDLQALVWSSQIKNANFFQNNIQIIIKIFQDNNINSNNHFRSSNPSSVESFCFGVLARSFAGTTLLPVTVIKTRYEVIWISKSICICVSWHAWLYHANLKCTA